MVSAKLSSVVGLAMIATVLAGCAGAAEETEVAPIEPAAEPEVAEGSGLGSLTGTVIDDELVPVAGAEVAVIEDGLLTTTDEMGKFTFNDLQPGAKRIAAQRLGYESIAMAVEILPDQVVEVQITLVKLVVSDDHYTIELQEGFITCGIGFPVVTVYPNAIGNACGVAMGETDVRQLDFEVGAFPEESYSEIVWTPSTPVFGSRLRSVNSYGGDGVGEAAGTSPITIHEDGYDDDDEGDTFTHFFWADFGTVNTTSPPSSINVILQQRFDLYFTVFYGMAMPEGYTAAVPA